MQYKVKLKQKAIKALIRINEPHYSNIKEALYKLAENPRPNGYIKLKGKEAYRIRVGNYRIIYDIFDHILIVDVIEIGHRKDIYN